MHFPRRLLTSKIVEKIYLYHKIGHVEVADKLSTGVLGWRITGRYNTIRIYYSYSVERIGVFCIRNN